VSRRDIEDHVAVAFDHRRRQLEPRHRQDADGSANIDRFAWRRHWRRCGWRRRNRSTLDGDGIGDGLSHASRFDLHVRVPQQADRADREQDHFAGTATVL
jgi:hypothetical protein